MDLDPRLFMNRLKESYSVVRDRRPDVGSLCPSRVPRVGIEPTNRPLKRRELFQSSFRGVYTIRNLGMGSVGIEPTTDRLKADCSTAELRPLERRGSFERFHLVYLDGAGGTRTHNATRTPGLQPGTDTSSASAPLLWLRSAGSGLHARSRFLLESGL